MTLREKLRDLWFRFFWALPPFLGEQLRGLARTSMTCESCGRVARVSVVRDSYARHMLWRSSFGHVTTWMGDLPTRRGGIHSVWTCCDTCEEALQASIMIGGHSTVLFASRRRDL